MISGCRYLSHPSFPGVFNSVADAKLTRARLNSSVLWIAGFLSKPRPDERRAGRAPMRRYWRRTWPGYSRLMGEDEEGTLAAPHAIRRELGDQDRLQTADIARRLLRGGELYRKRVAL